MKACRIRPIPPDPHLMNAVLLTVLLLSILILIVGVHLS